MPKISVGRATAASDAVSRTRTLKRLAFAVFSGSQDQYVDALPSIHECIFETLRQSGSTTAHVAVCNLQFRAHMTMTGFLVSSSVDITLKLFSHTTYLGSSTGRYGTTR